MSHHAGMVQRRRSATAYSEYGRHDVGIDVPSKRTDSSDSNERSWAMKVLITGACGQVGSHVAELLLKRGDSILGIENYATGRRVHLSGHAELTLVEGSIADKALVERTITEFKPYVVVHTAGSYKDPENWYEDTMTNCVGGANLIRAAKTNGVERFIYFQTALCYGIKPAQQPITLDYPKNP